MSQAKAKGTTAESLVVAYLQDCGYIHTERRTLNGSNDKGDIAGIPGVCIEVKNQKTMQLAQWVDEALTEQDNSSADITAVWHKRVRKGSPQDWYVTMTGEQFVRILDSLGYR